MFEEIGPAQDKNGRASRDRLIGVLVTLLFHALLGVLVYHGRFTVKILTVEKRPEVRNVIIVPPLKVSIPTVVGGRGLTEEPPEAPGTAGAQAGAAGEEAVAGAEEAAGQSYRPCPRSSRNRSLSTAAPR